VPFLVVLIVRLIDPVTIVLAVLNGYLSRSMAVLIALSVAIALVIELLLEATQLTRTFTPLALLSGFIAAFAWSVLVFWIRRKWRPAK
jgi:hypothetical protein